MKKRDQIAEIKYYLENPTTSRIIFTIFVYSEENKYFKQSDLQQILYNVDSKNITNSISKYVKKLDGLFFDIKNKKPKNKISFYPFDTCDREFNIYWSRKQTKTGCPLVPKFKWLEELYDIEISETNAEKLLLFFRGLKPDNGGVDKKLLEVGERYKPLDNNLDYEKFPGHKDTNILDLLKKGYEASFFLDKLGELIFKENLQKARTEYNLINANEQRDDFEKEITKICKDNGVKLDEYNYSFISTMLVYSSDSIFNSPELKKLFIIIWKDYINKRNSESHIKFLTISDIFFMRMIGKRDDDYGQKKD